MSNLEASDGGAYRVELFRPELLGKFASVLSPLLGNDSELSQRYIRWKHLEYPSGENPILVALVHTASGEVVGMHGFLPMTWLTGRQVNEMRVACWTDLVVHPLHQGKGLASFLFQETTKILEGRNFEVAIGFSQNAKSWALSGKLGWKSTGIATYMQKGTPSWERQTIQTEGRLRFYMKRAIGVVARKLNRAPRPVFASLDRAMRKRKGRSSTIEYNEMPRPADMARLSASVHPGGRLCQEKKQAYFEWRFKNPTARYRFLFYGEEKLRGYIVLQIFRKGAAGRVCILDLTAEDSNIAMVLLNEVLKKGGFKHVYMLAEGLDPSIQAFLLKDGFNLEKRENRIPSLIVKPLKAMERAEHLLTPKLLSKDEWHFQLIESDAF